jgi:hypothetical protein
MASENTGRSRLASSGRNREHLTTVSGLGRAEALAHADEQIDGFFAELRRTYVDLSGAPA